MMNTQIRARIVTALAAATMLVTAIGVSATSASAQGNRRYAPGQVRQRERIQAVRAREMRERLARERFARERIARERRERERRIAAARYRNSHNRYHH